MIGEYGTPEMADQLSGAIYMHASLTEDRCSQVRSTPASQRTGALRLGAHQPHRGQVLSG